MSKVLGAAEEQLPLFWGVKDCFVLSNTNCFVSFRFVNYQLFRFVSLITNCFVSSNTISQKSYIAYIKEFIFL